MHINPSQTFSEGFIRDFRNELNWEILIKRSFLSEKFIEEFADCINWPLTCYYQIISEKFIRKHIDKVNFYNVFEKQNISKEFILEYQDKIENIYDLIKCLRRNEYVSDDIVNKIIEKAVFNEF